MPIQDNLHGALLISAIDFILSFVIIGGIGLILAMFPLLNKFSKQDTKKLPVAPRGKELTPADTSIVAQETLHPGLSDQQLVVLLTAAAAEMLGGPVRVEKFKPLTAKDLNWTAQGRSDLQSHRLK
ncbi:MAG: hypothetical protein LWW87_10895 [Geobacteraceae bacterium]|nr:hypothetical protein [Geobacteraceae bacterium]